MSKQHVIAGLSVLVEMAVVDVIEPDYLDDLQMALHFIENDTPKGNGIEFARGRLSTMIAYNYGKSQPYAHLAVELFESTFGPVLQTVY